MIFDKKTTFFKTYDRRELMINAPVPSFNPINLKSADKLNLKSADKLNSKLLDAFAKTYDTVK